MNRIYLSLAVLFFQLTNLFCNPNAIYFIYPDGENLFLKDQWVSRPFYELRNHFSKQNIPIIVQKKFNRRSANGKLIVFINVPSKITSKILRKFPKKKLVVMLLEPPTVAPENYQNEYLKPFGHILSYCPEQLKINQSRCIKSHPYYHFFSFYEKQKSFKNRKLLALMAANKEPDPKCNMRNELYSVRKAAIEYFTHEETQFDLFGRWWPTSITSYKGSVENKFETLINYKFSICFENTKNLSGYVTEKLFDSFRAKCIPVYLGANDVHKLVPKSCFIDFRDFSNFSELHNFLLTMSEETYNEYIDNIDKFFRSNLTAPFSSKKLIEIFEKLLRKNCR